MNKEEVTSREALVTYGTPQGPLAPVKKALTFFRARVASARGELFDVPKKASATIIVRANAGFGNTLFVRGLGPGLSWDIGTPMTCVADEEWRLELGGVMQPVVFKILLNDEKWSEGEDYIVEPGGSMEITPVF